MKLLAAATLVGLAVLFLSTLERRSLYFPMRRIDATPKAYALAFEPVALKTEDGLSISAWWIPAAKASVKPLTLLLFHGNAGNISHRLEKAKILHDLGLNVLLLDYRGYGESEGRPSERGTYADAEAAIASLTKRRGIPADQMVFYGESLGGAVAVEMARRHPGAALILESPFTNTIDMGKRVFPWLPVRWIVRFRYDNLAKVPSLRLPLLVLHSREDEIIPFEMAQRVFAAAGSASKRFVELTGGHNDGFLVSAATYRREIAAFLAALEERR